MQSRLAGQKQYMERFTLLTVPYRDLAPCFPVRLSEHLYDKGMAKRPVLPHDEVEFLASLPTNQAHSRLRALWEGGWSLGSLGDSLTPARPKTTIHFWVKKASLEEQRRALPTPPPASLTSTAPTRIAPRLRSISPGVPPDIRPRLRELSELSRRYRSKTPASSPLAQANDELTSIAKTLRSMGVPAASIAEAAGVSYRAMARRLSR